MNKKTIIYSLRNTLGSSPYLFRILRLMMSRNKFITPGSDICIEGFARSANSFAHRTFKTWNPTAKVAHHLHVPYQVINAVQWQIPTIVLIRKPLDTLASLLIVDESLSLQSAIHSYDNFYRMVLPFKEKFVLAKFEDVIKDYHAIIQAVNSKFGTSFFSESLQPEQIASIFDQLERYNQENKRPPLLLTIPSAAKETAKMRIKDKISQTQWFQSAEDIYAEITAL